MKAALCLLALCAVGSAVAQGLEFDRFDVKVTNKKIDVRLRNKDPFVLVIPPVNQCTAEPLVMAGAYELKVDAVVKASKVKLKAEIRADGVGFFGTEAIDTLSLMAVWGPLDAKYTTPKYKDLKFKPHFKFDGLVRIYAELDLEDGEFVVAGRLKYKVKSLNPVYPDVNIDLKGAIYGCIGCGPDFITIYGFELDVKKFEAGDTLLRCAVSALDGGPVTIWYQ